MSRLNEWRAALTKTGSIAGKKAFLLEHSGLPGPRGNLELLEAAYLEGDERLFASCRNYAPELAPANSAEVFLLMVGVVGLAKSYLAGSKAAMRSLREYASDPRWRVREAVAIGLQHIGDHGVPALLEEIESWRTGNLLEQRAVVAGLCEPRLLRERATAQRVIEILADITDALAGRGDRITDELAVLRKSLGYGWSVAIMAAPVKGKAAFGRLLKSTDKDVRWIAKENLSKNRLVRMDADWVDSAKAKLAKAQSCNGTRVSLARGCEREQAAGGSARSRSYSIPGSLRKRSAGLQQALLTRVWSWAAEISCSGARRHLRCC